MLNSPTALPYISNPSVVHRSPITFPEKLANNALPLIPVGLWTKKSSELLCGRHRYISHSNLVGTDTNRTDEGGDSQPTTGHTHSTPSKWGSHPREPCPVQLACFAWFVLRDKVFIQSPGLPRTLFSCLCLQSARVAVRGHYTGLKLSTKSLCFLLHTRLLNKGPDNSLIWTVIVNHDNGALACGHTPLTPGSKAGAVCSRS